MLNFIGAFTLFRPKAVVTPARVKARIEAMHAVRDKLSADIADGISHRTTAIAELNKEVSELANLRTSM